MTYVNAPIHDLLIRIKNAYKARKTRVEGVQYSTFKEDVAKLLKQYKFIKDLEIQTEGSKKFMTIILNTIDNEVNDIPVIKFYATPSRPWYVSYKELKPVAGGRGIGIITTNKGVLPTHLAKKSKVGGNLIAEIY